jgi:hypothetical protein
MMESKRSVSTHSDEDVKNPSSGEIETPPPPPPPPEVGFSLPPLGREAWSLEYQAKKMAGSSQAADEEARAEVEVLKSRLEKTTQLTKKIQASLGRLNETGKALDDAVRPIMGNTQKLQIVQNSRSSQMEGRN